MNRTHQGQETACDRAAQRVNVGDGERLASILAGGGLALRGLRNLGSFSGLAMTLAGGGLIYRGLTGQCGVYQRLGIDTAHDDGRRRHQIAELETVANAHRTSADEVDEASLDSFPASDPPSWTATAASAGRKPR